MSLASQASNHTTAKLSWKLPSYSGALENNGNLKRKEKTTRKKKLSNSSIKATTKEIFTSCFYKYVKCTYNTQSTLTARQDPKSGTKRS